MPIYEPIELPKIERIDSPNGRRYKVPSGLLYPSVTTIFSVYNNKHIEEWKQNVGEEQANKIAKAAAKRGTYIHERCEELIKGININNPPLTKMLYHDTWLQFKPLVEKIGKVYANEAPLYSDYLKVAGTVDCVGYWEGKRSIIDFKTSSRFKAKEDIETYLDEKFLEAKHSKIIKQFDNGNVIVIFHWIDNERTVITLKILDTLKITVSTIHYLLQMEKDLILYKDET